MADETQTDAARAEDEARKKELAAEKAREAAAKQDRTAVDRKAERATNAADNARAKAEEIKGGDDGGEAVTTAAEAKNLSAHADPDRPVGDHHAQKFSNDPANPQLAPGLDPDAEGKVKLVLTDSDSLAAGGPKVTYVHEAMVGDYLRAGWSRA